MAAPSPIELTYRMALRRMRTDYVNALQTVKNNPLMAEQAWRRFGESMQHVLFWVDILRANQLHKRAGLPGVTVPQLRMRGFDPKATPLNMLEIIRATPWLQQHIDVTHGDLRQIADFVVGREKVYAERWKVSKAAVTERELAPMYRLEMFYRHGVVQAKTNAQERLLERPEVGDQYAFSVYQTKEDYRVRPTHAAANHTIICRQHPDGVKLLKIIQPPNGWGCRCGLTLVSVLEARRRGWIWGTGGAKFAIRWPSTAAQRAFEEGRFPDEGWGLVRGKRVAEPTMDWRNLLPEDSDEEAA